MHLEPNLEAKEGLRRHFAKELRQSESEESWALGPRQKIALESGPADQVVVFQCQSAAPPMDSLEQELGLAWEASFESCPDLLLVEGRQIRTTLPWQWRLAEEVALVAACE